MILLKILFVAMLFASCSYNSTDNKVISSVFVSGIKVDGNLDDWELQNTILLSGDKSNSENRALVRTAWDNDYLYFSFEVTDTSLISWQSEQDHKKLFEDDMAELLFDCQNDKDSCWDSDDIVYHINLLGIKKDDRGNDSCKSDATWNGTAVISVNFEGTLNDTTDSDNGYVIEISLPWEELGLKPEEGLAIGVNFAIGDNDGKDSRLFDWVGAMPYRSPYAFGSLILK